MYYLCVFSFWIFLSILFTHLRGMHIHESLWLGFGGSGPEEGGWKKKFQFLFILLFSLGRRGGLLLAVKMYQQPGISQLFHNALLNSVWGRVLQGCHLCIYECSNKLLVPRQWLRNFRFQNLLQNLNLEVIKAPLDSFTSIITHVILVSFSRV